MLATDLILQKIQALGGVKGCVIVGQDGLVIDSVLPQSIDKDLLSALISAIHTETTKQSNRFKRGEPKIMVMETDSSVLTIIKIKVDTEALLVFTDFKKGLDTTHIMDSLKQITSLFK